MAQRVEVIIVSERAQVDDKVSLLLSILEAKATFSTSLTALTSTVDQSTVSTRIKLSIQSCHLIIIVLLGSPRKDLLSQLLLLVTDECSKRRRRIAHLVLHSKESNAHLICNRAKRMLRFHDLDTTTPEQVVLDMQTTDTTNFSSPGESFAWQLVTGFLSYILPLHHDCIRSTLLDDTGSVRQDILQEYGITDVDPNKILVIPKYFLLFNERLACGQQSTAMCPSEMFPGCKKISKASSELCLEFDSPGYKKRIPSYLFELDKPITSDQSTFTHVIIFCGYAAPTFVIQKLDISIEEKELIFQQFRDELKFILSHPKSSQLLCESSECGSQIIKGDESSVVNVIDVTDENSLKCHIVREVKNYILTRSWYMVPKSPQQTTESSDLMVRFSTSVDVSEIETLTQCITDHGLKFAQFPELLSESEDHCGKFLFVVHLKDLETMSEDNEKFDSESTEYHRLMFDITCAVRNMHRYGKYNISVLIIADVTDQSTFDHLPECLKHLPDNSIVAVSNLNQSGQLQYSHPSGLKHSGTLSEIINNLDLCSESISADDALPLMSMAYAMAANSWIGFAQPLLSHLEQVTNEGQQLPLDLPYCFVIPKSGRYPNEAKLHEQLEEIGVNREVEEFRVASGRRYTFQVHKFETLRIAFEIPSSVLSIRKQAECGVGGIKVGHLPAHLSEFRDALHGFSTGSGGRFRVIEWDDVTDFCEDSWSEPSREFARSLLDCLASAVRQSDSTTGD